jgi:hypothetical protein
MAFLLCCDLIFVSVIMLETFTFLEERTQFYNIP